MAEALVKAHVLGSPAAATQAMAKQAAQIGAVAGQSRQIGEAAWADGYASGEILEPP